MFSEFDETFEFCCPLLISILIFSVLQNGTPIPSAATDQKEYKKVDTSMKFESNFLSKVHALITGGETRFYNVIIYVVKAAVNGEELHSVAKKNKDSIANKLKNFHGGKNIVKAKMLSFVSASLPLKEIEKLADYDSIYMIGDGESKVRLTLNVSRLAIAASGLIYNGSSVKVAVIDEGMYNHTLLPRPGKIVADAICDTYGCSSGYNAPYGPHGTTVGGIVAAFGSNEDKIRGIAYGSSLMNVQLSSSNFTATSVGHALDWALSNGAKVINMSIEVNAGNGYVCTENITNLMADEAVDEGAVVVVAAGNSGSGPSTVTNPGCGWNILSVGAIDDQNTIKISDDTVPIFSSRGPFNLRMKPNLAAPGVNINTTTTDNGYAEVSGTSFAAPHVAGAAAIILQAFPGFTPLQVRTSLLLGASWNLTGDYTSLQYEKQQSSNYTLNSKGF